VTARLAALLSCLLVMASAASAQASQGGASASIATGARLDQARRFWTPERMREARELPVHLPGNAQLGDGAPGSSPPTPLPGESVVPTETIADPTAPGVSQNGVIFVVGRFGTLGRCSGTSVNAPSFSLVITAGHCVHEGRHWMGTKWVFVPGYHYGQRPFGTFVAKWLGSTPQWIKSQNSNYDVGAAVVSRNERGQRLADAVGADEIAWNLPHKQDFDVYGYPVADPFDGATLQHCAQTAYEGHAFFSLFTPGPLDLAVHCEISPGASGGGWVISGGNVLNGVTTDGYSGDDTDYGPYFGKEVGKLYGRAVKVK
jgi:V8-like Glu-specific endopeptidase